MCTVYCTVIAIGKNCSYPIAKEGLGIRSLDHSLFALLLKLVSKLLLLLYKKERCEWFARVSSKSVAKTEQIAQNIRIFGMFLTVSKRGLNDSLPLLFTKERTWAIRSDCSWQKSKCEQIALDFYWKERRQWFARDLSKLLSKNKQFARKTHIFYVLTAYYSFPSLYAHERSRHSLLSWSFLKSDRAIKLCRRDTYY